MSRKHPALKICPHCGIEFRQYNSLTRHCSRACASTAVAVPRRAARARTCPVCSESFVPFPSQPLRKYCSQACYFLHVGKRPAILTATCDQCGSTFKRTAGALKRVNHTFCSSECSSGFFSGPANAAFRGGHAAHRGKGWAALARSIRERDGHRCRRCGKTATENGQALSVDHITPWRTFTDEAEANQPSNLASLCRSCHSKKTNAAERLWIRGDVLDMWRYQIAVSEPWTKEDPIPESENRALWGDR